jgi:hypothetical protein
MSDSTLEFRSCTIVCPDGTTRPGWEMWEGPYLTAKSFSKDDLLLFIERRNAPPISRHWKHQHDHSPFMTKSASLRMQKEKQQKKELKSSW